MFNPLVEIPVGMAKFLNEAAIINLLIKSGNNSLVYVPDDDIMLGRGTNNVNNVTSNNIRMVLEAYRKNRPVFYPGSSKRFVDRRTGPVVYYAPYDDLFYPVR